MEVLKTPEKKIVPVKEELNTPTKVEEPSFGKKTEIQEQEKKDTIKPIKKESKKEEKKTEVQVLSLYDLGKTSADELANMIVKGKGVVYKQYEEKVGKGAKSTNFTKCTDKYTDEELAKILFVRINIINNLEQKYNKFLEILNTLENHNVLKTQFKADGEFGLVKDTLLKKFEKIAKEYDKEKAKKK